MTTSPTQQSTLGMPAPLLPVQEKYPTALYIICPILITYFGIYVTLRNHYIFKPRVEKLLNINKVNSVILRELVIDFVSSLSVLTLVMSSIVLSNSDQAVTLILHQDLYWAGLCVGVIAYRKVENQQNMEMKVMVKNGVLLVICYGLIVQQYYSKFSFVLMGLLLMVVYAMNSVLKLYEQKFIEIIEVLFHSKHLQIKTVYYNHVNQMQSPEYLATNFAVTQQEIQTKLHEYQFQLKSIRLKTKQTVTRKLLALSLAIRLSHEKMQRKMKKSVAIYYGGLNGTNTQKVKKIDFQQKNTHSDTQINKQTLKYSPQITQQQPLANSLDLDDQLEVLFTIFPVKLFESSGIISVSFTLLLNFSFGFCLDYIMSLTSTLTYGAYFNILYSFLVLPLQPNTSPSKFFNSMALSSLWKYLLVGLFVIINLTVNGGNVVIRTSTVLPIQALISMVMVCFVIGYLAVGGRNQFKLLVFFFILFSINLGVIYTGVD